MGIIGGQILYGAVALRISAQLLFSGKITARPRKYLAVGVKLMYDQTH